MRNMTPDKLKKFHIKKKRMMAKGMKHHIFKMTESPKGFCVFYSEDNGKTWKKEKGGLQWICDNVSLLIQDKTSKFHSDRKLMMIKELERQEYENKRESDKRLFFDKVVRNAKGLHLKEIEKQAYEKFEKNYPPFKRKSHE